MKISAEPAQAENWKFVDELKLPDPRIFNWPRGVPVNGEAHLAAGIRLNRKFPDSSGALQTAYDDLVKFLCECGIPLSGDYEISTETADDNYTDDRFKIIVTGKSCRIIAGNAEGIRRGIYHLEDGLLGADGPFLKIGEMSREPWIKNRISRCFFGPIKRPPLNRDELLDDIDYYPEEYLNRLAHEGINGLWLTIKFSDLCKTSITPEYGKDSVKRLAKLRITVDKCLRYGIKTYIFCIEPAAWKADSPILKRHPELGGAVYMGDSCFCPFSKTSQQYLYEAVNGIFKAVPGLGGMINITHGERLTTCLSSVYATDNRAVDCPVCSKYKHWEIIHSSLSAMEKGMHAANPDAQLISWLYMPHVKPLAEWVFEIPEHVPDNVTLQFNFESGGEKEQLGKPRIGGDYWLSYIGPCERYQRIAESAIGSGAKLSAKIQVGCSHEVATIPFVPVPALLYRKYSKMHELGVSSVMQCWYFGNYPGIMNKTAGMLAFEDFKSGEKDFLEKLALPDWGSHADDAVAAWMLFADGYSNYPLSNMFQYYGPMHDGVVWPLYLYPVGAPLAPTWKLEFGTSGDCIGECLENHTIDEAIILCREISEQWNLGVKILNDLRPDFAANPDRLKDIGLAEALGIQFESGHNILRFYALREQLFNAEHSQQKTILNDMEDIVHGEINRSERLIKLCENDSRLGFHSEAEGYKYFPEKLQWRVNLLENLLQEDFPRATKAISDGRLELPNTANPVYVCGSGKFEQCETFRWKADNDSQSLHFEICCENISNPAPDSENIFLTISRDNISFPLSIEIIQTKIFLSSRDGCSCDIRRQADGWCAKVTIPYAILGTSKESLKICLIRWLVNGSSTKCFAWGGNTGTLKYRGGFGVYDPSAMSKLIINTGGMSDLHYNTVSGRTQFS